MRNYKRRSNQTRPENAGAHNIPEAFKNKNKVKTKAEGIRVNGAKELLKRSNEVRGMNWTAEELNVCAQGYLEMCAEYGMKPCKAGIRLYLGCSSTQYNDWERNKDGKYGAISDSVKGINDAIEMGYVSNVEKYPTGNIFLLKTSHGHVETSKMDITSDGKAMTSATEVKDMVGKLGLDKK